MVRRVVSWPPTSDRAHSTTWDQRAPSVRNLGASPTAGDGDPPKCAQPSVHDREAAPPRGAREDLRHRPRRTSAHQGDVRRGLRGTRHRSRGTRSGRLPLMATVTPRGWLAGVRPERRTLRKDAIAGVSPAKLAAGSAISGVAVKDRAAALFLLTIVAGVAMAAAGLLRLGRYTRFISLSVMLGFSHRRRREHRLRPARRPDRFEHRWRLRLGEGRRRRDASGRTTPLRDRNCRVSAAPGVAARPSK
jgi:hypothetical protein